MGESLEVIGKAWLMLFVSIGLLRIVGRKSISR